MASGDEDVNFENPFEVSRVLGDTAICQKSYESPYDFDLDGNLVVCGSHVILPPICVYTGETEDLEEVQKHTVIPSMKLVITQRTCCVITFIARSEQARRRRTASMFGAIMTVGIMLMVAAWLLNQQQTAILFPLGLMIFGVTFFLLHRLNMTLTLVKYKAPGIFWVRGFSDEFLARLAIYKLNSTGRT